MSKNMIIGQSGGPTAVINSSLAGAIEYAFSSNKIDTVYGMINGIQGLLENNIIDLKERFYGKPYDINRLRLTPAMFLGSCRYKLGDDEKIFAEIIDVLKKYNIGYFLYIGGNDSMDTVDKLSKYTASHNIDIKIVGVPKTIDNDLVGIDHSPGFGSAAKYIALAVKNVAYDTSIYIVLKAFILLRQWVVMPAGLQLHPHLHVTVTALHLILFICLKYRFLLINLLRMLRVNLMNLTRLLLL